MRVRLIAASILSTALSVTSASAIVLISDDNGGRMEDYRARFQQVRRSGDSVVIDGTCSSACTMVLGLVPLNRICATSKAALGFEAAWEYDKSGTRVASAAGTQKLMKIYPASVRTWIARHGGLTANVLLLRGRELTAIVRPCRNG